MHFFVSSSLGKFQNEMKIIIENLFFNIIYINFDHNCWLSVKNFRKSAEIDTMHNIHLVQNSFLRKFLSVNLLGILSHGAVGILIY